ncbi:MAG: energy transducer TonB [Bacteroidaceae bacterium]|nr:energy transducer TonB [Bacteroidaceae bacterium]
MRRQDLRCGGSESSDPVFNNEALRLVKSMPKWTPGTQNGQPVRCRFQLPITFRIV